jgi:hypothetical protein
MRLRITLGTFYKNEISANVFDTESDPQAEFNINVFIYTKQADIMEVWSASVCFTRKSAL